MLTFGPIHSSGPIPGWPRFKLALFATFVGCAADILLLLIGKVRLWAKIARHIAPLLEHTQRLQAFDAGALTRGEVGTLRNADVHTIEQLVRRQRDGRHARGDGGVRQT